MADYFAAADVTHLNNKVVFLNQLPHSLNAFNANLNLRTVDNLRLNIVFEINTLIGQAAKQAIAWQSHLSALRTLHSRFQPFFEEFTRLSKQITDTTEAPDSSRLVELAQSSTYAFLVDYKARQNAMESLAKSIYALIPRLIDYLNDRLYQHALQHNMVVYASRTKVDDPVSCLSSAVVDLGGSSAARRQRKEALTFIDNCRREYALSYLAVSNFIGHFTRLRELATICLMHAIKLSEIKNNARINAKIKTLLVSLKEMQHLSQSAHAMFRH